MDAIFGTQEQPPLDPSMCCMSVVADGPRIAFAAYNEESATITLEECYANGHEVHSVVERVLMVVRPTLILVNAKLVGKQSLMQLLTTPPPEPDEEEATVEANAAAAAAATGGTRTRAAATPRSIPYQTMKTSSFDVRSCHSLILQKLRVRSLMKKAQMGQHALHGQPDRHFPQQQQGGQHDQSFQISTYHALASVIDFQSNLQIQAVGSLLSFLNNAVFQLEDGGYIIVNDFVRAKISLYMSISSSTLSALHVFATEYHPLVAAKGAGNAKEGFSLFSLLDRTSSRSGRQRLRDIMLKPLVNVEAITMRQNGVELFMLPEMHDTGGSLMKLLARVLAVDKILLRIQKCTSKPSDVVAILRSLGVAIQILDMLQHEILFNLRQRLRPDPSEFPGGVVQAGWQGGVDVDDDNERATHYVAFVEDILQSCSVTEIKDLYEQMSAVIDESAMNDWHTVVIRQGYNERLDQMKDQYIHLPELLEVHGEKAGARLPALKDIIDVIFLPQIGFLVRLENDESWAAADLPDDFDFIYKEGDVTCFKDDMTRELDITVGDLDSNIKDQEALAIAELEDAILTVEMELRNTFTALADLDCILSFAGVAIDMGYVRPKIVPESENCIEIVNGRHPLQETILENSFIPNDTNITSSTRLSIVTGPNFSGKSCYARQVGVLVYMAHIGAFIPCDAARISVHSQIFARFSTVETCAVPQSSFQLDLSEMGTILRRAGRGSLVLIDEFGKGTSPASGIALLAAALKKLSANEFCKVICTTHFLEVFSMDLLSDGVDGVKALNMAVQIPETTRDTAVPLFKLKDGVASSSAGLVCAEMAGVKRAVIERATEIVAAVKERRQVQPLAEILRGNLFLPASVKETLDQFVRTDWTKASDNDINDFLQKVHRM